MSQQPTPTITRLLAICLLIVLVLAACRKKDEATPTPQPTVTTAAATNTPAPVPTAQPTAIPISTEPQPVDPADIDWPPQIVYSSPLPGEETTLNGAITIRFDQPMNRASVEAAFAITQAQGSTQAVRGSFTWPRSDTVVFTPSTQLTRQQRYNVRISPEAQGLNGQSLEAPVLLNLETVGYIAVSQVIPSPDTNNVQTDSAITVLFNRPIVPLTATSQQSNLPQPLQFTPPLDGQGQWVSTSVYRFVPDAPLDGASRYQVTVNRGLEDIVGAVLEEDYSWSFTTVSPSVVTISPNQGRKDVDLDAGFSVQFNMPMNRASTEGAITLSPATSLQFSWTDEDRTVLITPTARLNLGTDYTLTVDTGARSANGAAALNRLTRSTFTTIPLPAIVGTYPENGAIAEAGYFYGVQINFASPMDEATLLDKVLVEPAPARLRTDFWTNGMQLVFPITPNTRYTVTVPGSAADPYGNTLGRDYVFSFTTSSLPPVVTLNLPTYLSQLTTQYPTTVEIGYRSTDQINVSLYDVGLPLRYFNNWWAINEPDRFPGTPIRTWQYPVTSSDQVNVLTAPLADGDVLPTGVYVLIAEPITPSEPYERYWQNQRNLLVIADTNLVVKETFGFVHVWATDLATGQPASGRAITLYNYRNTEVGRATTDSNGLARIPYTPPETNWLSGVVAVSNAPGQAGFGIGGSSWDVNVSPYQFGLNTDTSDEIPTTFYIVTDRPIYRPGDTLYYRGIVRDQNYGRYSLSERTSLTLNVNSYNYYSGSEINSVSIPVTVDARGNFSGEFAIPADWPLGTYALVYYGDDLYGERTFTVAEYRAPEFLVEVTSSTTDMRRGETAEMVIEASYFFGGPATDLAVEWQITADQYFVPWEGPYYSFTDSDYSFYYFDPFGPYRGTQYLINGSGRTDAEGRLTVTIPADLLANVDEGSWKVTLEATVYDLSQFPVSARASLNQHAAATYVGIAPANYLSAAGTQATVNLITIGWQSQPVPNTPVDITFYRREWQSERTEQYGQYSTRWIPVDSQVGQERVTTDNQGRAAASFTPEEGGTYVAKATVTDNRGGSYTSSTFLWVTDPRFIGWRSDPRERRMDLTPDKNSYNVGETATILVQSPFSQPVRAWLIIERGTVIEERIITLNGSSDTLTLPIPAGYAPNVFVSVVAIQGTLGGTAFADIRLGMTELVVNPEQLSLNIAITSDRTLYQPGETASYTVQVTDHTGSPVVADVSLALVDLAVLTLKPDNAPPILETFYARQPLRSRLGSGLFYSGEGLELEVPNPFGGLGGGGGGDASAESVALRDQQQEDDVRKDFRDTAYWQAIVTTNSAGTAVVEVKLPDNLTTWRMSAKAATVDTLVGQTTYDIISTKPLLIRPVTPRFMTVGDVIELGAIVNNNSGSSQTATVRLNALGVTLQTAAEQTITIPSAGSVLVRWPVVVEDREAADLTFRVSNAQYTDASKPTFGQGPNQLIPIYRYTGEDIVGTSGMLTGPGRRVEGVLLPPGLDDRQGTVEVQITASLAAALLEALTYNETYDFPPTCAYAFADRLLATSSLVYALDELNVGDASVRNRLNNLATQDITALLELQRADGGWGWCFSGRTDSYLTGQVFFSLVMAQRAGFTVSAAALNRASSYIQGLIAPATRLTNSWQVNRQAFYLYILTEAGNNDTVSFADELFTEHRDLLNPYAKGYLVMVYEKSGSRGSSAQQSLIADLNDTANLSAAGAHWENHTQDWNNLSSDIRGTAIILSALLQADPDNLILPNVVRWLMVARTASHWPTTIETAWSIHALADWMIVSGELNANYTYLFQSNLNTLAEGSFNQNNLGTPVNLSIPLSSLVPETVNFLDFQLLNGNGNLYYTAYLDSFIDAAAISATSRGISVQRTYYDATCNPETESCPPITRIGAGQQVRVQLNIVATTDLLYAIVEDYFPAGAEAIDPGLETSASNLGGGLNRTDEPYRYGYWGWWYFNRIEYRNERIVFYSEFLPAGTYQYTYYLQTIIPGVYQVRPTLARQEFFPDVFGRSDGMLFVIEP
ncbi:MAG: Ig-like domain-containing protein [Anaerolineae bacterium]|nr:Ig-like domain-containing protein [Anaerolineae bacterium]